jgi:hypothetical protein
VSSRQRKNPITSIEIEIKRDYRYTCLIGMGMFHGTVWKRRGVCSARIRKKNECVKTGKREWTHREVGCLQQSAFSSSVFETFLSYECVVGCVDRLQNRCCLPIVLYLSIITLWTIVILSHAYFVTSFLLHVRIFFFLFLLLYLKCVRVDGWRFVSQ